MKRNNIKILTSIIIILALLLSSCDTLERDLEQTLTQTPSSTPNQTPKEDLPVPKFAFKEYISTGLPVFTFTVYEKMENEGDFINYVYDVHISCDELTDYTPQSIEISSKEKWEQDDRKRYIDLVDIDFDGNSDIQAATAFGVANTNYSYYCWDNAGAQGRGEFETKESFGMLVSGYTLYPDIKQICGVYRENAVTHIYEIYQLNEEQENKPNKYEIIRYEEVVLGENENGEFQQTSSIFFGEDKIYTATFNGGDEENNRFELFQETVANYLHFGVESPISREEAQQLLIERFGKRDDATGFLLDFVPQGMCVYEKMSCYRFCMRWFVDGSHWSTLTFWGVTPQGEMFEIT